MRKECALPRAPGVLRRLLRVKFFDVLHPKAEKVRKLKREDSILFPWPMTLTANLRRRINLRLPDVLSLSQDGGSHQLVPILAADEVRSLEKDGCAVAPWHSLPPSPGGQGAIDSTRDSCLICLVIYADVPCMIRRNQLLGKLARLDLYNRVMNHYNFDSTGLTGTLFMTTGTS